MSALHELVETVTDFQKDADRLLEFEIKTAHERAYRWFLAYARHFARQRTAVKIELSELPLKVSDVLGKYLSDIPIPEAQVAALVNELVNLLGTVSELKNRNG